MCPGLAWRGHAPGARASCLGSATRGLSDQRSGEVLAASNNELVGHDRLLAASEASDESSRATPLSFFERLLGNSRQFGDRAIRDEVEPACSVTSPPLEHSDSQRCWGHRSETESKSRSQRRPAPSRFVCRTSRRRCRHRCAPLRSNRCQKHIAMRRPRTRRHFVSRPRTRCLAHPSRRLDPPTPRIVQTLDRSAPPASSHR